MVYECKGILTAHRETWLTEAGAVARFKPAPLKAAFGLSEKFRRDVLDKQSGIAIERRFARRFAHAFAPRDEIGDVDRHAFGVSAAWRGLAMSGPGHVVAVFREGRDVAKRGEVRFPDDRDCVCRGEVPRRRGHASENVERPFVCRRACLQAPLLESRKADADERRVEPRHRKAHLKAFARVEPILIGPMTN